MCTLRRTGISPYLGKYAQFRCLTYVSVGQNETSLVTIHVGFLHSLYKSFHSQNLAHMIHSGVATALSLVHSAVLSSRPHFVGSNNC